MKNKDKKSGYVLVVALVVTIALGVVAVGLAGLVLQELRLSARSSAHSRALYAAESGAELACEEFSKQSGGAGAWSGWSSSGALRNTSGNLPGSAQYSVTASNSAARCIITSTGTVSVAGATVQRVVRLTIEKAVSSSGPSFKYGILSKAAIHIGGSVMADSFDSTDPAKSTNGQYDPAKASANATLATLSDDDPAIRVSGGGRLNGISTLSVAPGGTIDIAHWIPFTGTKTYDAEQEIPDVEVPSFSAPSDTINVGPWPNQNQTITVSGSQDLSVQSLTVSASGKLTVMGSGTIRIYVDGKTKVSGSGQLRIVPSPSTADLKLEIYANDDVSIAGSGVLNNTYRAGNCAIWGTENCEDISVTGNSEYIGTIYAPYAAVSLTGSSGATGAFLGGAVSFTGASKYHIDESLIGSESSSGGSGSGKNYNLIEWVEL
jgi:Tfp pilus assembly protein PilX